jgi:hypothetical protein
MTKKKLIIFGNTEDCLIANKLLNGRNFEIVGGLIDPIRDKASQEDQRNFLKRNNLVELNLDTIHT